MSCRIWSRTFHDQIGKTFRIHLVQKLHIDRMKRSLCCDTFAVRYFATTGNTSRGHNPCLFCFFMKICLCQIVRLELYLISKFLVGNLYGSFGFRFCQRTHSLSRHVRLLIVHHLGGWRFLQRRRRCHCHDRWWRHRVGTHHTRKLKWWGLMLKKSRSLLLTGARVRGTASTEWRRRQYSCCNISLFVGGGGKLYRTPRPVSCSLRGVTISEDTSLGELA